MAGRLGKCLQFWLSIGASQLVLKILKDGYSLPFVKVPVKKHFSNHESAPKEQMLVSESIMSLPARGCISEKRQSDVAICSPLGVVNNGKKLRLILNLRFLNRHLAKFKFKLEDLRTVAKVYRQGDYLVSFDLKSGYHHITIAPCHWKYLGFQWENVHGKTQYFVFCVLPFGLSTAPYIFTKVTWVLLPSWHSMPALHG